MARGPKSYFQQPVIASPVIQQKGWRATDSCFALIGAHQCGVLMDEFWMTWLFLYPPQVKHLCFQQKQIEAISQGVTVHSNRQRWELFTVAQCSA